MKGGIREGYGIHVSEAGYYDGYWSNDKADGMSIYKYFNGDIYNG